MAISKKQILESINAMPEEEFDDIDVLLERIMILDKIEKAEKDISEGKVWSLAVELRNGRAAFSASEQYQRSCAGQHKRPGGRFRHGFDVRPD